MDLITRIMLVEDDKCVRNVATIHINARPNFTVESFEHGFQAYNRLVELNKEGNINYYKVLISDIDMPEMDGKRLALEAGVLMPTMPIILMTGNHNHSKSIPSNVNLVLYKPFSKAKLYEAVDQALKIIPATS